MSQSQRAWQKCIFGRGAGMLYKIAYCYVPLIFV